MVDLGPAGSHAPRRVAIERSRVFGAPLFSRLVLLALGGLDSLFNRKL